MSERPDDQGSVGAKKLDERLVRTDELLKPKSKPPSAAFAVVDGQGVHVEVDLTVRPVLGPPGQRVGSLGQRSR